MPPATPPAAPDTLQEFFPWIIAFIDTYLVPLIFTLAFIVFLWGVFQYFIAGGADEEKREKGKKFVAYGLVGFFVMISVWGLVNLLVSTFGFNKATPSLPRFGAPSAVPATGNDSDPFGGGVPVGGSCQTAFNCDGNPCIEGKCQVNGG